MTFYVFFLGWIEVWWDHGRPWPWGILTANSCKDTSQRISEVKLYEIAGWWFRRHRNDGVHSFPTTGDVTFTVIGQRYTSRLQQYIIFGLQARQRDTTTVFIKDGEPPHVARCVKEFLHNHFGSDKITSRKFPTAFPKSPTWIFATFDCGDTSKPWSTVTRLNPTLKNA